MSQRNRIVLALSLALACAGGVSISSCYFANDSAGESKFEESLSLAQESETKGDLKEAIKQYQALATQLKTANPDDVGSKPIVVNCALAQCLEKDGRKREALEAYELSDKLAMNFGGLVFQNISGLPEISLRAAILRNQLGPRDNELAVDFERGVKACLKFPTLIPKELKLQFFKDYESYASKSSQTAAADKVASLALVADPSLASNLTGKGDKVKGLLFASDIFIKPLRAPADCEEDDWKVTEALLNEALTLSSTDEQKTVALLKLVEFDGVRDDEVALAKNIDLLEKYSVNYTRITPAQKFKVYCWKANSALENEKTGAALKALEECIKLASTTPDVTLKQVNDSLNHHRLPSNIKESGVILTDLLKLSEKIDGPQSYSYGTSCANYGTYLRLSPENDMAGEIAGADYDVKAVKILSQFPEPGIPLATIGVNAGRALCSGSKYKEAADILEFTLAIARKEEAAAKARGEEVGGHSSSAEAIEKVLAEAYSELKDFDKLKKLSDDTVAGTAGGAATGGAAGGSTSKKAEPAVILREAYMAEQKNDYVAAEKLYDEASAELLKQKTFDQLFERLAGSQGPYRYWTSQYVPEAMIGFYERIGRFDKITPYIIKLNNNGSHWQLPDSGQFTLASCYMMGGDYAKAKPILESGFKSAPATPLPGQFPECGTGMPVYKSSFGHLLACLFIDGYQDGASAIALYQVKGAGLTNQVDLFNRALALDLMKKYDEAKVYHDKVIAAQKPLERGPNFNFQPDIDRYKALAFKHDRNIEETAELMECFAWMHELPDMGLDTCADRAILVLKKRFGADSPQVLAALQRLSDRCAKTPDRFGTGRAKPVRNLRLVDAQAKRKA